MVINKKKMAFYIAIPLVVGGVSSLLTKDAMKEFEQLNQPPLSPPGWLFPIVWTILYVLMGISYYLVSTRNKETTTSVHAEKLYYWQLLLNFLWPVFFFNFGWYLFAFAELIVLWVLVIKMILKFYQVSKSAAFMNIPYLLWLTFAAYLNLGVWWLNR